MHYFLPCETDIAPCPVCASEAEFGRLYNLATSSEASGIMCPRCGLAMLTPWVRLSDKFPHLNAVLEDALCEPVLLTEVLDEADPCVSWSDV